MEDTKEIMAGTDDAVPEDRITYFIFFIWGVGILLPWNAVMTEFDYLEDEVSNLYYNFQSLII